MAQYADLTTYHEEETPEDEADQDTPDLQNAQVEGDDVDADEGERLDESEDIEDKFAVQIQGESGEETESEVTIRGNKEAVDRIKAERMLHRDYTQKTQEVARQRDGIAEVVRQAQDAARTQYVQQLESLRNAVFTTIEPEIQDVNWQKLAHDDPVEHQRLAARAMQMNSLLQKLELQQREAAQTQAREDHSRLQERIGASQKACEQLIPDWSDMKYRELLLAMNKRYGFSPDELYPIIDPRIIKLFDDATKYHQGTNKREIAKKKIASTPKTIPSGHVPQQSRGTDSGLESRFRKTGSIEDAARLLSARRQRTR